MVRLPDQSFRPIRDCIQALYAGNLSPSVVLVIRECHLPLTRRWVEMCCSFLSLTATNSANIFFRTNSPGDMPPSLSPSAGLELTSAEAIRVCLHLGLWREVNKGGTSPESLKRTSLVPRFLVSGNEAKADSCAR